jgi:AraC-like DNA-binding protein
MDTGFNAVNLAIGVAALSGVIFVIIRTLNTKHSATDWILSLKDQLHGSRRGYENMRKHLEAIIRCMEHDKLYLDRELTLDKLAQHAGISVRAALHIIDEYFQKDFEEFVNQYRVKEVKLRLEDPSNKKMTTLSIALQSGFNSHAAFQRAFKNVTGMSALEYRNQYLQVLA